MGTKYSNSSLYMAADNVGKRELGAVSPRSFTRTLGGSQIGFLSFIPLVSVEDLIFGLRLFKKLVGHREPVNTVSFNAHGDIVMSGSDDMTIILWNWVTGNPKLTFESGHSDDICHAKFIENHTIVTCGADGEVRCVEIDDSGLMKTTMLSEHEGGASKLAIEPDSSHTFYSCGKDGFVRHFDLRTPSATKLFRCYPHSTSHRPVELNDIAIDPRKPNLLATAGSNKYARIYDMRRYKRDPSSDFGEPMDCFCPLHLIQKNQMKIGALAFSEVSELLVSYQCENIYLFNMGTRKDKVQSSHQVYIGHKNDLFSQGMNTFGPSSDYVASGSDCGRIFIWEKKNGELLRVIESDREYVNCIECHPHIMVLASSGADRDVKIWHPESIERAALPFTINKPMDYHPTHHVVDEEAIIFDFQTKETADNN